MAAGFMTHVTCRLTAKEQRDQLRDPTLGNRVLATFTFFSVTGRIDGKNRQACVLLPTYANNVALPAFARRCCSISQQSIDISCRRAHSSKPAAAACCDRMGQTERQTDARQLHRPCSAYYAGSVNNEISQITAYDCCRWLRYLTLMVVHIILPVLQCPGGHIFDIFLSNDMAVMQTRKANNIQFTTTTTTILTYSDKR